MTNLPNMNSVPIKDAIRIAQALDDLGNARALSDAGWEWAYEVMSALEAAAYERASKTPSEALCKLLHLVEADTVTGYRHGPELVADAKAILTAQASQGAQ